MGMNIVVLEDDADAREALAALLSLDAYEVRKAHDPLSFGQATRDLRSQAIIFDLQLDSAVSGLSLAMEYQQRRQAAGLSPARLIALSGSADPAVFIAAARAPFPVHHSFTKPVDHDRILAALTR